MTTWAPSYHHNHLNHPWFATPSMKRKLSSPPSPPSSSTSRRSSESTSPPPTKRRRQTALETNFSNLSLQHSEPYSSLITAPSPYGSYSPSASARPAAIDVDEEPPIPEIKMKTSTWYEPEPDRIVITDLDSSSDEETEESQDKSSLQISPALLHELTTRSRARYLPESGPSQALVLYKPLPITGAPTLPERKVEVEQTRKTAETVPADDDAMDIEP